LFVLEWDFPSQHGTDQLDLRPAVWLAVPVSHAICLAKKYLGSGVAVGHAAWKQVVRCVGESAKDSAVAGHVTATETA
jgi:hypothetical protein